MLEPSQPRTPSGIAGGAASTTGASTTSSGGSGRMVERHTTVDTGHLSSSGGENHSGVRYKSGEPPESRNRHYTRAVRRPCSTASSLDADDEADSASHSATSPAVSTQRSPSPPVPQSDRKAASAAPATADRQSHAPGVASSSSQSSSSQRPDSAAGAALGAAPLRAKKDTTSTAGSGAAAASSRESTPITSREASMTALTSTTGATSATGSGLAEVEGKQLPTLGPSVTLGAGHERNDARAAATDGAAATRCASPLAVDLDEENSSPSVPMASIPPALCRRSSVNLEQYGCCVFFFPTPILSWLFPLSGHVAISNAEGTRLYTFESSYFVREERMLDVLDRVVEAIHAADGHNRPRGSKDTPFFYRGSRTLSGVESDGTGPAEALIPPFPGAASSGGEEDDVVAAAAHHRDFLHDARQQAGNRSPRLSSAGGRNNRSYPGSPIRRQAKQLSSINSGSHSHANCIRIWDLKPLLMESRGRGEGRPRLPLRLVSKAKASNSTIAAIWQRLQDLIPVEGGVGGSSSEAEEERNRLLDPATARFYNRNLQATINIFRGSPEGSRAPLDIIVKFTNSYSFVGFVLETCGLGGGPPVTKPRPSPLARAAGGAFTGAAAAADPSPPSPTTGTDAELVVDGISWGTGRILLNIFLFGEWHRSDRRVWRAVHGGTVAGACFIWTVLIALIVSFAFPLTSGWLWGLAASRRAIAAAEV